MRPFSFSGTVGPSKSLLNRWQIIQSFSQKKFLNDFPTAISDDVRALAHSLAAFDRGQCELDCGSGGTTFRFLAARVSRQPGDYLLRASARLLARPHDGLMHVLRQLGVRVELSGVGLRIITDGWKTPDCLNISTDVSSQFASAILLSAWELETPLKLQLGRDRVSSGYWEMSVAVARHAGMEIKQTPMSDQSNFEDWVVERGARVNVDQVVIEPDISSCFALAAIAGIAGRAEIHEFPHANLQPDFAFVQILSEMGVPIEVRNETICVQSAQNLKSVRVNLKNCPDLLPVLSVLCAAANGRSEISGIAHAQAKESNRVVRSQELLAQLGVETSFDSNNQTLIIYGRGLKDFSQVCFVYNPDQDHRMAMAAQLARWMGAQIDILHPEVVTKSFPEFWTCTKI